MKRTLITLILFSYVNSTPAQSIGQKLDSIESKVGTVEQRQRTARIDLDKNAIARYRNAVRIDSVTTDVIKVNDTTATIEVKAKYHIDREELETVNATLSHYFKTGIYPSSPELLYVHQGSCVEPYCQTWRYLQDYVNDRPVGIKVSYLGDWEMSLLNDNGTWRLSGISTFRMTRSKAAMKKAAEPVVTVDLFRPIPNQAGVRYVLR